MIVLAIILAGALASISLVTEFGEATTTIRPPSGLIIPGDTDGETTDRETTDGETTDGETTDGETTDGETSREEGTTKEETTQATEPVTDTDYGKVVDGLANYEAPVFVWKKQLLKKGETASELIKQAPIKLADGGVEDNKAIMVKRGDWATSERGSGFILNPEGKNFEITLFANGKEKGKASGLLLPLGYGCAMWCRDAKPGEVVSNPEAVGQFNCYFKTFLKEDGGVEVLWTMLHPEEH